MPLALTYPGVYVEEIPGGVRSITGVATSITAFVGRAARGPVDQDGPVVVNSYADFERVFGGLWLHSPMTYAVRDFFGNGGSQAVIVRLYRQNEEEETHASITLPAASASGSAYELTARYPGSWGNRLRVRVDHDVRELEPDEATDSLFNLYVRDDATGVVEEFRNVSISSTHARRVDKVLSADSTLVTGAEPGTVRPAKSDAVADGDGWVLWDDNTSTAVADADRATDGIAPTMDDYVGAGKDTDKTGLYALERADLFNLLCLPPYASDGDTITGVDPDLIAKAAVFCEQQRAVLIVDPPWSTKTGAVADASNLTSNVGTNSRNAALFFPRLLQRNPLRDNRLEPFAPCGAVAGVIARTDAQRGVWKAPAGLDATLVGVPALQVPLTDRENGELNPLGVNCLRTMPAAGPVVWGARTMQGSDRLASEWKYLPVRRTALFLEESLFRGTQWVVFEPNDEPLWAQIRLNIGAFLHELFRQGAFQGLTPKDAYFVKCDKETTTQSHMNSGIVNIVVGFAPLKPAEFVVIKLQQMAGQLAA